MSRNVKTLILPCFQASKLAWLSLMDACRRYATHGSETKVHWLFRAIAAAPFPTGWHEEARRMLWVTLQVKSLEFRKPQYITGPACKPLWALQQTGIAFIILDRKQISPLLHKEKFISIFHTVYCINHLWKKKKKSETKAELICSQNMQKIEQPMEIYSPFHTCSNRSRIIKKLSS